MLTVLFLIERAADLDDTILMRQDCVLIDSMIEGVDLADYVLVGEDTSVQ